ncbi:MAG: RluA family pseudouridine synthase [Alphaproteobacteria bacterium]
MDGVKNIFIKASDDGERLDKWFKRAYPDVPFGLLAKICRQGQLRLDSCRVKPRVVLREGQKLRIPPLKSTGKKEQRGLAVEQKERFQSWVLHEDKAMIVINKPAGLAVQGGTNIKHCVDDYLQGFSAEGDDAERLCLVHRLDKDTSGVLLIAKGAKNARVLTELFQSRDVQKMYWALTSGIPERRSGVMKKSLGRGGGISREKTVVDTMYGQEAITAYRVLDHFGKASAWLELRPETGRKHQIRAHLADLGAPVLGDGKYGGEYACRPIEQGRYRKLHLHARALTLPHPTTGRPFSITAPLPPEMIDTWEFFGFDPKEKFAGSCCI